MATEASSGLAKLARDAGFQKVDLVPTSGGKAGVFATLDAGAKTSLAVYFMYDVKQFDPSEWSSPPLEARVVDGPGVGKIMVGRGSVNSKGPNVTLLAALHAFKAAGQRLPVNLVLVCEGEEEIGLDQRFVQPIGYLDLYLTFSGFRILPALVRVDPGFSPQGRIALQLELDRIFDRHDSLAVGHVRREDVEHRCLSGARAA